MSNPGPSVRADEAGGSEQWRRSARGISLLGLASVAAHVGTSTMPFQVSALMDGAGMTASAAAAFCSALTFGLALSMILVAP